MTRTLKWRIETPDEGKKIEEFLREHGCYHHVLTHLKRTENGICRNGQWAYANQRLCSGDLVQIHITEQESSEKIVPTPLPLDIVFEDEDLMVINKCSDTPIHPSIHNYDNTLANAVMYYFSQQNLPFVYRCINRLDRDTSGLLIVAKNMMSGAILSQMSSARLIHREYLTIVEGRLPEYGTVDAPIARLDGSAIMRCVDFERGDRAVTHYRRIAWYPLPSAECGISLAAVKLETGRTHQIRVHMKHIGHPMLGDFLYNPDSLSGGITNMKRQALHSHKLSFSHPVTGEEMSFTCDLPEDMKLVIGAGEKAAAETLK